METSYIVLLTRKADTKAGKLSEAISGDPSPGLPEVGGDEARQINNRPFMFEP